MIDAITGDYVVRAGGVTNKKNSLSMDWPRSMVIYHINLG